jgi:FlaA1/EpsC-like NDP-sugar epimerase
VARAPAILPSFLTERFCTMRHPILVTGGNGTLGRGVVARLLDAGHEVGCSAATPARPAYPLGWGG